MGGQHARAWRLGGLGRRGHLWRLTAHEISGSSQHTGWWDPWQPAGWGWWAPKGCLHHGAQVRAQTFPSQGSPGDARLALQADGVVLEGSPGDQVSSSFSAIPLGKCSPPTPSAHSQAALGRGTL